VAAGRQLVDFLEDCLVLAGEVVDLRPQIADFALEGEGLFVLHGHDVAPAVQFGRVDRVAIPQLQYLFAEVLVAHAQLS
jgi:hypothetical protein